MANQAVITDRNGNNQPFFLDYYEYHSIATADFSPTADPSLSASHIGEFKAKGFLVMPWSDGLLYGITLRAYLDNNSSLTGLTPQKYLGLAGQWIPCRMVKVYANNNGTYPSASTEINIGMTI